MGILVSSIKNIFSDSIYKFTENGIVEIKTNNMI
jgi:hypothetical protein